MTSCWPSPIKRLGGVFGRGCHPSHDAGGTRTIPVRAARIHRGPRLFERRDRAEIAGTPAPGADEDVRGFVGVAFRLQKDMQTYDVFYLRATNGRAEDQERRNHAAQYMSHPQWPWSRLRKETPGKYEAYVDLVPGAWTKIKIEVRGEQARLYVHDHEQPTLIVNDVKSGAHGKGAVALWLGPGTVAHFRNLTVDPAPVER